jgi:hypothetical protein
MYKIIGADQREYGPISGEQVRQWIHEGRLNATSKIQVEGAGDWKLLREIPEFSAILPAPPPPITYHAAPGAPPANSKATWALVTGILSILCCQVFAPVSIVLGAMALSQIKQNPHQGGRGMAVAGIIMGCVSILLGIVVFVVFLLTPGLFSSLQNGFPR